MLRTGFDGIQGDKLKVVNYVTGKSYEVAGGPNGGATAEFFGRIDVVSGPFCELLSRDLAVAYPGAFAFSANNTRDWHMTPEGLLPDTFWSLESLTFSPNQVSVRFETPLNASGVSQLSSLVQELAEKTREMARAQQVNIRRRAFELPNEMDKAPARTTLAIMGVASFVLGIVGGWGILAGRLRSCTGGSMPLLQYPQRILKGIFHNG